jgi:hypothetical protein
MRVFMEYSKHIRCESMEKALKKAGLKVVYVEKHGNKTIITVTRYEQSKTN